MARFAIVLPVMASGIGKRQPADDRHPMVHFLPVKLVVDVAMPAKKFGWEDIVLRLGFLKTQDIGLFLDQEPLNDRRAGAHRVDIPGSDFHCFPHSRALAD
jgi:hypothetical protein